MSSFNAAVYDAVMVGTAETLSQEAMGNPSNISKIKNYTELFKDNDFFTAVSGSVNDAAKVATRINAMIGFIKK